MRKNRRKQVAAMLLVLALVVTTIPAYEVKADSTDFVVEGTTLISYEGSASSVTIPKNITVIGREAFENNGSLVSVTIQNRVETIEAGAFSGCRNLGTVSIPASVTKISPSAFSDCDRLKSISIDKKNTSYICEDGAVYKADKTKLVQVLAGREKSLFTIPNQVKEIDRYAFWGCDKLENVKLGSGLTKLPSYAFSNMPNLKTMEIPDAISEIEMKAFENCVSLGDLYISPNVVKIHDTAFDGCRRLHISSEVGTAAYKFFENFEKTNVSWTENEESEADSFYVNDEEDAADSQTVSGNSSQNRTESNYASANVEYVGPDPYVEPQDAKNVMGRTKIVGGKAVVFIDNSNAKVYDSMGSTGGSADSETATDNGQDNETAVLGEEDLLSAEIANTKYVIVNGDTIADRAFYKEENLTSYEIDDNVKNIGDFSFARSGLKSIRIPYGVEHIGYGAFYNCSDLSDVSIPTTVKKIEPSAFRNTAWLKNWKSGGDVHEFLVVGDGILIGYKGFGSNVTIPENVKQIGAEVFMDHTEIETVTLPDSLKEIAEDAFAGCVNLKNVSGGSKVERVRDRAFRGCNIRTIRVPDSVKSIGLFAYGEAEKTDSIVFQGDELPKVSYEKTATRLSNKDYRRPAFDGIHVAIVSDDISSFEGTVLTDSAMGFSGVICSVIKEPTLQSKGEVSVKKVSQGNADRIVSIPDSVWIYGKEYYVTNVATNAIEKQETDIADSEETEDAENILTDDETASENNASATEDGMAEDGETASEEEAQTKLEIKGNLAITVKADSLNKAKSISVDMSNDAEGYELVIAENEDTSLREAIEECGVTTDDFSFIDYDMKLYEKKSGIPISKLGTQRVTMCLPIPSVFKDKPVVAVCLDDNGQPEYIPCVQRTEGEDVYVIFEAKHFSPYALLCGDGVPAQYKDAFYEKVATKKAANYSAKYGKKDESPDTGDYSHPKWFLIAGLVLMAAYLFLTDQKPVKTKNTRK